MEKVIKFRRLRRFGIVLLVSFPGIFAFLHLGPTLGFDKTPKNLSSLKLSDGSQLVLFQKRKDSFLEAYTTMLCRIYPEGHAEAITIGYEDSYWWLAKLHPFRMERKAKFGRGVCVLRSMIRTCRSYHGQLKNSLLQELF